MFCAPSHVGPCETMTILGLSDNLVSMHFVPCRCYAMMAAYIEWIRCNLPGLVPLMCNPYKLLIINYSRSMRPIFALNNEAGQLRGLLGRTDSCLPRYSFTRSISITTE